MINSWETFYFSVNQHKFLKLAKTADKLGLELVVLDDGWFSNRINDSQGLGDYDVNLKKFPRGFDFLEKLRRLNIGFGLWLEPEMVNPDSKLYRDHPDWAVKNELHRPLLSRNQLVLDLTKNEVCDYIYQNVAGLLGRYPISYVKWDMNRPLSDYAPTSGRTRYSFCHNYILSLYGLLRKIRADFPEVTFEHCASGGNRFDLGMLSFSDQIWASDNTDPIQRLSIQKGYSYLYPLSCLSNHISASPHFSSIRATSAELRFHTALFGVLGYELDLSKLSRKARKDVSRQIGFYREYRQIIQFGRFWRHPIVKENQEIFEVGDQDAKILCVFSKMIGSSSRYELLKLNDLDPAASYSVYSAGRTLGIGGLQNIISHAFESKFLKALISNRIIFKIISLFYRLKQDDISFTVSGQALMNGIPLPEHFMGTGYNSRIRMNLDLTSELFLIRKA